MKIREVAHIVQPDTYEASMALNQLLRIGQHSVKLHGMIDDAQEMESWVAKKIDLAGDYVKKVYNYTQGEKAGFYESKEEIGDYAKEKKTGKMVRIVDFEDGIYTISYGEDKGENDVEAKDLEFMDQTGADQEEISKFDEDAGEGHMSKSTLYTTAKYAIALMQMIKKGDDLEGWVQSKLNKAADYLQGVYNYEEYQKLNPYREDIDENTLDKHSEIIKRNIDEILSKETKLDDIDTKPGMMRILNKRVNEFEKKMAKEYKMPKKPKTMQDYRDMMKAIQDIETMPDIMKDPEMKAKVKQRKMQLQKDMPVLDKEFDDQPRYKGQRMDVGEKHGGEHSTSGRSMTKGEMSKREKIVKGMKKDKAGFKKRYGKDADAVMYATATKQAMEDKYEFRGNPFPILGKAESYLNFGADLARAVVTNDQSAKAKAETYLDRVPSFVNTEMKEIFPKNESGILYRAGVKKYGKKGMTAIQSASGKGASHQEIGKIKDKYLKDDEIDEGLKDTLQKLAAAGVIVGTMAGAGAMINALDNSVPAMQAMNNAYEMAVDAGNEDLAKMIKNDISAVKVRLSSGKDLNFVKSMQDKYIKFMPTENIAYESKLTVKLNQRLK